MKKILKIVSLFLLAAIVIFVLVSMVLLADLRTPEIKNDTESKEQIAYAKSLLQKSIKKQGLDKFSEFSTYEVICSDYWKGFMGGQGNPWGWNTDKMVFRFSVGDFDGQVEVLEGTQKGFVAGIQSWDYYEKKEGAYQTNVEDNGGIMFTSAAYHYFFELGNRLFNAPFIRYAGEAKLRGKDMEKIFVSWGNEATNDYDQYLLWIGKKSGLIEATAFTTRDNPKPAPKFLFGSLQFEDFRKVDGVLIPFKQTAQIGSPSDDTNDFVHQLTIENFEWNKFPVEAIRPFKNLKVVGDDKLVK